MDSIEIRNILNYFVSLYNRYFEYKPEKAPFPPESILCWCLLLAIQEQKGTRGSMLEVGVQFGGTAFLLIQAIANQDKLYLVDMRIEEKYQEVFDRLPDPTKAAVTYAKEKSDSPALNYLEDGEYRFIHIDGGHSKADVISDFQRFARCVSEDGIVCMDDFYEIRWPGVTEAIYEVVPGSELRPFLLVNRKLYLTRAGNVEMYRDTVFAMLEPLEKFGTIRSWVEPMLGSPTGILKIACAPEFSKKKLQAPTAAVGTIK